MTAPAPKSQQPRETVRGKAVGEALTWPKFLLSACGSIKGLNCFKTIIKRESPSLDPSDKFIDRLGNALSDVMRILVFYRIGLKIHIVDHFWNPLVPHHNVDIKIDIIEDTILE